MSDSGSRPILPKTHIFTAASSTSPGQTSQKTGEVQIPQKGQYLRKIKEHVCGLPTTFIQKIVYYLKNQVWINDSYKSKFLRAHITQLRSESKQLLPPDKNLFVNLQELKNIIRQLGQNTRLLPIAEATGIQGEILNIETEVLEDWIKRGIKPPSNVDISEAVSKLEVRATSINPAAASKAWLMGLGIRKGVIPKDFIQNPKGADDWFLFALRAGYELNPQEAAIVCSCASERLKEGSGSKSNTLELLNYAAEAGNINAIQELGDFYLKNDELKSDPERFLNALGHGYKLTENAADIVHNRASEFIKKDDMKSKTNGLALLKFAAEAGNTNAMNDLGVIYDEGILVDNDPAVSFQYYRDAANRGNPVAAYNLAWSYLDGEGIEKNETLGVEWLLKAAAKGDRADAMNDLANCYRVGIGVKRDRTKAQEWEHLAILRTYALMGKPDANYDLGLELLIGSKLNKDVEGAIHHLKIAGIKGERFLSIKKDAENGDAEQQYVYALYLTDNAPQSIRQKKNPELAKMAYEYISKSASQGHLPAIVDQAGMLEMGIGTKADRKEAIRLYQLAIDKGSKIAPELLRGLRERIASSNR